MTDVIYSIKPKYAKEIKEGRKSVEIRKVTHDTFWEHSRSFYIYESAPEKKITAIIHFDDAIRTYPDRLWKEVKDLCGLTEDEFFKYCSDPKKVYCALFISKVEIFEKPWQPSLYGWRPPQNWRYLTEYERKYLTLHYDKVNKTEVSYGK